MTNLNTESRIVQGATAAVRQPAFIDDNGFSLQSGSEVKSITTMTFAPDGKLIVADWKSNALHALSLPKIDTVESGSFNLYGVDNAIAQALDTESNRVRIGKAIFSSTLNQAVLAVEIALETEVNMAIAMVQFSLRVELIS